MKKYQISNLQKGFTLLEVLIGISILAIVFLSFLSFFPQVAKYNQLNAYKLDDISLSKEMLLKVQSSIEIQHFIENVKSNPSSADTYSKNNPEYKLLNLQDDILVESDHYELQLERNSSHVFIKIYKYPDITGVEDLYKVAIEIEKFNGSRSPNLYGYIPVDS